MTGRPSNGFQALANSAPDAILTIDEASRILFANPASERLFGYQVEELVGESLLVLIPDALRQRHRTGISRYVRTGERNVLWTGIQLRALRKDGSEFPIEVSFGEFNDETGRRVFSGFVRDVSERVRQRQELEAARANAESAQQMAESANDAKSQFLANMSHELRTPINAVIGYADLIMLGLAGPLSEQQRMYLQRIVDSSRHLAGLVNDVLDFSRMEAGKMRVSIHEAKASGPIRGALELVQPLAKAKSIAITERCDSNAAFVGDPDRVRQILVNLIGNAVKFTPPGGHVSVACATVPIQNLQGVDWIGPWLIVEVQDTGVGIPQNIQTSMFEPFVQADAAHTRREAGTGLGLTISRKLARLMRGDITVRSAPGKGSCFTVWLPQGTEASAPMIPASSAGEIRGLGAVGRELTAAAESIVGALGHALRADEEIPSARGLDRAQLHDHIATMLVEVGNAMITLDESGGEPALMRDGSTIQSVIAERHGAQRHRLGFDTAEVKREYAHLQSLVRDAITSAGAKHGADIPGIQRIVTQLLNRAESISLDGLSRQRPRQP